MGARGQRVKAQIDRKVDDPGLRSVITHTPITKTQGTNGGYGAATETEGVQASINAIPIGLFNPRMIRGKMGNIAAGDVRLVVKGDESIGRDDKVTYTGNDYEVKEVKQIPLNDVVCAQIISLTKETA